MLDLAAGPSHRAHHLFPSCLPFIGVGSQNAFSRNKYPGWSIVQAQQRRRGFWNRLFLNPSVLVVDHWHRCTRTHFRVVDIFGVPHTPVFMVLFFLSILTFFLVYIGNLGSMHRTRTLAAFSGVNRRGRDGA